MHTIGIQHNLDIVLTKDFTDKFKQCLVTIIYDIEVWTKLPIFHK